MNNDSQTSEHEDSTHHRRPPGNADHTRLRTIVLLRKPHPPPLRLHRKQGKLTPHAQLTAQAVALEALVSCIETGSKTEVACNAAYESRYHWMGTDTVTRISSPHLTLCMHARLDVRSADGLNTHRGPRPGRLRLWRRHLPRSLHDPCCGCDVQLHGQKALDHWCVLVNILYVWRCDTDDCSTAVSSRERHDMGKYDGRRVDYSCLVHYHYRAMPMLSNDGLAAYGPIHGCGGTAGRCYGCGGRCWGCLRVHVRCLMWRHSVVCFWCAELIS